MLTATAIQQSERLKTKKEQKWQTQEQKLQTLVSQHSNSPLAKALLARLRRGNTGVGRPKSRLNSTHLAQSRLAQSRRVQQDIRQVKQMLHSSVKPAEADRWLAAPNPLLNGNSPMNSIRQGRTWQVNDLVERLAQGIYM